MMSCIEKSRGNLKGLFCFILVLWLSSSCDIINPSEQIPSYLEVNSILLSTLEDQGAATQNIHDVWITSEGDDLGVFPLPATIPVLSAGSTDFIILMGIRVNGRSASAEPYVFYEPTIQSFDLIEGETLTVDLETSYTAGTKYSFIEDFENGTTRFTVDLDDFSTSLEITDQEARNGSFSGGIFLTETNPIVQVATAGLTTDVLSGIRSVFVELDYKNETEFIMLLMTQTDSGQLNTEEIVTLRPREDWNKVYLDISQVLSLQNLVGIQIGIFADLFEKSEASIFVDNIKLIYE